MHFIRDSKYVSISTINNPLEDPLPRLYSSLHHESQSELLWFRLVSCPTEIHNDFEVTTWIPYWKQTLFCFRTWIYSGEARIRHWRMHHAQVSIWTWRSVAGSAQDQSTSNDMRIDRTTHMWPVDSDLLSSRPRQGRKELMLGSAQWEDNSCSSSPKSSSSVSLL